MNTSLHPRANNYHKALARLQKSLQSGKFARYSHQKKLQIWNRLCRYARQLGLKVKESIAAACMAAGLCLSAPAIGQTFTQQTGAANPFNGVDVGIRTSPVFVDIDNDGDQDCFTGAGDGTVRYYRNTGTASSPVYTEQTGAANPFNGVTIVAGNSVPDFADLDNDGDKDAVFGNVNGSIFYYRNTGTAASPAFTPQTGGSNPFNGLFADYSAHPAVVDIDNDGDQDFFFGNDYGQIQYFRNTGTAASPVFAQQFGASNPLNGVDVGAVAAPTFVDIDGDGDRDCFIGAADGTIRYYRNTGTASAPVFTVQTGANNPFDGVDIGSSSSPVFVDNENDGDLDAFIGEQNGTILYYLNNTISVPLKLLSFSGSRQADHNQLQWQTANEVNTRNFEIERSNDGRTFTKIATINTTGNGNNNYHFNDNVDYTGKMFYRLKMVDIDNMFTYSPIIWISSEQSAGVRIYPNPVKDVININMGNARILKTMAGIYDANGRLIQNILINNHQQQINVTRLTPGLYTLKFADGSVHTFIKE